MDRFPFELNAHAVSLLFLQRETVNANRRLYRVLGSIPKQAQGREMDLLATLQLEIQGLAELHFGEDEDAYWDFYEAVELASPLGVWFEHACAHMPADFELGYEPLALEAV